jgi:hypothetical protein
MFFSLPSWAVALIVFAIIGAATAAGYAVGRYLREHEAKLREPFGVLQGALLGVVGLILAFGLTLAVGRYEDRRTDRGHRGERDRHELPPQPAPRGTGRARGRSSCGRSTRISPYEPRRRCPTARRCDARPPPKR